MPLKGGNGRNVDEDVIARLEGEMGRSTDHQAHHFGGKDHTHGHPRLAFFAETSGHPEGLFQDENGTRAYKPFPKMGGMKNKQDPIDDVEQMTEVKHL